MNTKAIAKGAAEFGGPLVLAVGASLVTLAAVGTGASGRVVAAGPTATVTVTRQAEPVTVSPSASPSSVTPTPRPGTSLVAASASPRPGQPDAPGNASSDRTGAEHTPPDEPGASPSRDCTGSVLAVQLRLGVLPDCAITVGGNR